mmetsp:Transcript_81216/g.159394  ORF Transcript_81216/g.159394 Transcript_81216/m.159394 type:complete len:417 (+) Transcript_81216:335-1585(+)
MIKGTWLALLLLVSGRAYAPHRRLPCGCILLFTVGSSSAGGFRKFAVGWGLGLFGRALALGTRTIKSTLALFAASSAASALAASFFGIGPDRWHRCGVRRGHRRHPRVAIPGVSGVVRRGIVSGHRRWIHGHLRRAPNEPSIPCFARHEFFGLRAELQVLSARGGRGWWRRRRWSWRMRKKTGLRQIILKRRGRRRLSRAGVALWPRAVPERTRWQGRRCGAGARGSIAAGAALRFVVGYPVGALGFHGFVRILVKFAEKGVHISPPIQNVIPLDALRCLFEVSQSLTGTIAAFLKVIQKMHRLDVEIRNFDLRVARHVVQSGFVSLGSHSRGRPTLNLFLKSSILAAFATFTATFAATVCTASCGAGALRDAASTLAALALRHVTYKPRLLPSPHQGLELRRPHGERPPLHATSG